MLKWLKICNGFAKRIDSKFPFFYYTSTHDRFYEGEMQSFDVQGSKKSTSNPGNQRGRTAEQPGKLASGRASLIRSGHGLICRQFHAVRTSNRHASTTYCYPGGTDLGDLSPKYSTPLHIDAPQPSRFQGQRRGSKSGGGGG